VGIRQRLTIARLSSEQEEGLPEYRAKWLKVALDTKECDREAGAHWIKEAFRFAGLRLPGRFFWEDSPLAALRTYRALARVGEGDSIRDDDPDRVVVDRVVEQMRSRVRREMMRRVKIDLWAQVWSGVSLGIGAYLGRQIGADFKSWSKLLAPGAAAADWLGTFDFLWREVGQSCVYPLEPLLELAQQCGWWLAHGDEERGYTVILSEKPVEVHLLEEQLHNERGASLRFRDGTTLWYLHGVRVHRRIVETPAADMPLSWWLDDPVAKRRQVVEQKIGADRIADELGAQEVNRDTVRINGKEHQYSLLQLRLPQRGVRRALRMINPSTGETHTEWVPREIESCREALMWRNGSDLIPRVLT
jgi:hypothetical protein